MFHGRTPPEKVDNVKLLEYNAKHLTTEPGPNCSPVSMILYAE